MGDHKSIDGYRGPEWHHCDCPKKLEQMGIPLYINDENDFYAEDGRAITYERAFGLPGILEINDEVTEYLRVEDNDLSAIFEQMAEVFPTLWDYEENVLSFWILDVLIEGLWTAQDAKFSFRHQKAALLWIAYFFNYIQKENPSRKQLFNHLKVILLSGSCEHIEEADEEGDEFSSTSEREKSNPSPIPEVYWRLPLPPKTYASQYKPSRMETMGEGGSGEYDSRNGSESFLSLAQSAADTERNLSDMKIILEILYRIFARVYAYQYIQTVFNMMPSLEQINLPFKLKAPKPIAKLEVFGHSKMHVGKKASVSEKPSEDIEAERSLLGNNYILPLEAAEEAKEYLKQPSSDRSVLWKMKDERGKK